MLKLQALRQAIKLSERIESTDNIRKDLTGDVWKNAKVSLRIKMSNSISDEDYYIPLQIGATVLISALEQAIAEDREEMAQIEKEIREDI